MLNISSDELFYILNCSRNKYFFRVASNIFSVYGTQGVTCLNENINKTSTMWVIDSINCDPACKQI